MTGFINLKTGFCDNLMIIKLTKFLNIKLKIKTTKTTNQNKSSRFEALFSCAGTQARVVKKICSKNRYAITMTITQRNSIC